MIAAIRSRLRHRSGGEIASLVIRNIRHAIAAASPRARALRATHRAFDRRWGTETSAGVSIHDLGFDPDRAVHFRRYDASSEAMLGEPLAALGLDPRPWSFVDYGAGKGRVVMLAIEAGFAAVVGVELSARLCDVARTNLAIFTAHRSIADQPAARSAHIVQQDATTYRPQGRLILAYFYNPFDAAIMAAVRGSLEAALAGDSEQIVVIYANPEHGHVFADAPGWTERPAPLGVSIFVAGHGPATR